MPLRNYKDIDAGIKKILEKNTGDRAEGEFFNLDIYPIIPYI